MDSTVPRVEYADAAVVGRAGLRLPGLRRMRERQLLTQQELARESGISRVTIGALEAGAGARFSTIRKLAKALDCTPADLYETDR